MCGGSGHEYETGIGPQVSAMARKNGGKQMEDASIELKPKNKKEIGVSGWIVAKSKL